jgi:hypothetical protein
MIDERKIEPMEAAWLAVNKGYAGEARMWSVIGPSGRASQLV